MFIFSLILVKAATSNEARKEFLRNLVDVNEDNNESVVKLSGFTVTEQEETCPHCPKCNPSKEEKSVGDEEVATKIDSLKVSEKADEVKVVKFEVGEDSSEEEVEKDSQKTDLEEKKCDEKGKDNSNEKSVLPEEKSDSKEEPSKTNKPLKEKNSSALNYFF
ncbi:hypothetical protein TUBRATIS_003720 [Tubulinosema ratisbonensis]|uniref:Uncharacterized protein n=1 Tax=Tubulinosema ratisbonensis TaxID=291195 RepID=A0A437AQ07_9MICR|nr:hypothetical protein TUBRATIS_003720 [Tubulinosema ratisbonensis]